MTTEIYAKELLRPDEVAKLFRVTVRTIYNWVDEGIVEPKRIGGVLRITTTSVMTILRSSNS